MESQDLETYFGVVDFVVFFASFFLSTLIGVYFGCRDKNKKSIDTYYFGDKNVSSLAVGLSMAVSFVSAITILGYPTETYFYGIVYLWIAIAIFVGTILAVVYYIPLIFRLQMKSMYEYLELRYNKYIRRLCSGIFTIDMIFYMGNTVYLPALALNSVTPLDLKWSIALTSLICTFYTALGGIKAVIWTDVLQCFIMAFGALALCIKATVDVGGIGVVMETAHQGGRFNFFQFESDIRMRTTSTGYFLGFFILSANVSCFSQVFAQRYLSCSSIKKARRAAMIRIVPASLFMLLAAGIGLAMYSYYEGCDPYKAGYVVKKDQLTPQFAVEIFRTIPGLAGLFVAAAYSGTLSTVSSGINSLAATATEDFVDPFWPTMSVSKKSLIARIFTVVFGCSVMSVAYLVSQLKSTVIQISLSLAGIFNGTIFAVFLLGSMCPWVNSKGVVGGIIIGSAFTAWCSVGRIIHGVSPEFTQTLPTSIDECVVNATVTMSAYGTLNMSTTSLTTEALPERSVLDDTLYSISPFLYGFIGFLLGGACMIIISGVTGFNKPSQMKPELFVPLIDNQKLFPKKVVKFFRFGVPEIQEKNELDEMVPLKKDVTSDS